ncbi:MAG TPA: hypothetical protein PKE66_17025, partial [Pyrinomonadaceae bacterium]|nr:hypothetical protein [Pyrinomonadaceae bacterium]
TLQDAVSKDLDEPKGRRSSRAMSSFFIGVLLLLINLPIAAAGLVAFVIRLAMRSAKSLLRLRMPCEAVAGRFEPDRLQAKAGSSRSGPHSTPLRPIPRASATRLM